MPCIKYITLVGRRVGMNGWSLVDSLWITVPIGRIFDCVHSQVHSNLLIFYSVSNVLRDKQEAVKFAFQNRNKPKKKVEVPSKRKKDQDKSTKKSASLKKVKTKIDAEKDLVL